MGISTEKEDAPEDAANARSMTSVKVAVRVRPMIGMETRAGCQPCMFGDAENNQVVAGDNRCFRFGHVFGMESTQQEVYESTTRPLVERCLDGFNATVLAYGQTGSGKTWTVGNAYTVNGAPEDEGIIPRTVVDIFSRVKQLRAEGVKVSVHASFLEVLNEEIKDLLVGEGNGASEGQGGLPLRENTQGDVTVAGLTQHEITGAKDLGCLLERGALCRATASTNMNVHSSRSHAICTLSFEMVRPATDEKAETVSSSKFHLVDLAGSERAKKTGAEGRRLREGININKGLLALGNVISALSDGAGGGGGGGEGGSGSSHVHVPYRDSKLTRLLQSSLGGNAHTVMIACISPADSNMAESLNTLRYAGRAMRIKNTAVKNEGTTGPPVSYAEVMALRREIRTLQVQLVQAQVAGLAGVAFGGTGDLGNSGDADSEVAREAVEEAAELRRGQADLERRVLEATRHTTAAVEGEMSARMESDRWRLRCEQLCALVKDAAPSVLASMPSWATGALSNEEPAEGDSADLVAGGAQDHGDGEDGAGSEPASGSLARELRQSVFELEAKVSELEGQLAEAREAVAADTVGGTNLDNGRDRINTSGEGDDALALLEGDMPGEEDQEDPENTDDTEELRRVDREIEYKEREMMIKAEQARAYEAMKGQFEGLLGRLQGEVSALQSERDGLLCKLAGTTSGGSGASSNGRGDMSTGVSGKASHESKEGAAFAKMKARVAELEARIKENRKKQAEHQRAERERVAAAREAERLRSEVAEAKQRRAELQRQHRQASTRFMKETRQLQRNEARMRRDGERMQWQMKKLQDSQNKTQAALKRKVEEHSLAIRKMRKLQSQRPQGGMRGSNELLGVGGSRRSSDIKVAKRAEMTAWLATEIEEASAVQRAKRALKEQLRLRTEAAQEAQELQEEVTRLSEAEPSTASDEDGTSLVEAGGDDANSLEGKKRELKELGERVAVGSKVIQDLQAFLVSSERNSASTGTRLAVGAAANARWSRLRTPWDTKTALSLLLGEAVKAKVLGMDFAESAAVKDLELRKLSHEIAALRSAAAAKHVRTESARQAMESVVAKAVEAVAEATTAGPRAKSGSDKKWNIRRVEEEEESDEGEEEEGGEPGSYDYQEKSFVVVNDTDDEDEDDDDDDDEDDEDDEEWLPAAGAQATKKRSSQSSTSSTAPPSTRDGRFDSTDRLTLDSRSSRGVGRHSNDSNVSSLCTPGPLEDGGRFSRGSGPLTLHVSKSSPAKASMKSIAINEDGDDVDEADDDIDWGNLDSYTVVQLKVFLRKRKLPVSGKKDTLIKRLRGVLKNPSSAPPPPGPSSLSTLASPPPCASPSAPPSPSTPRAFPRGAHSTFCQESPRVSPRTALTVFPQASSRASSRKDLPVFPLGSPPAFPLASPPAFPSASPTAFTRASPNVSPVRFPPASPAVSHEASPCASPASHSASTDPSADHSDTSTSLLPPAAESSAPDAVLEGDEAEHEEGDEQDQRAKIAPEIDGETDREVDGEACEGSGGRKSRPRLPSSLLRREESPEQEDDGARARPRQPGKREKGAQSKQGKVNNSRRFKGVRPQSCARDRSVSSPLTEGLLGDAREGGEGRPAKGAVARRPLAVLGERNAASAGNGPGSSSSSSSNPDDPSKKGGHSKGSAAARHGGSGGGAGENSSTGIPSLIPRLAAAATSTSAEGAVSGDNGDGNGASKSNEPANVGSSLGGKKTSSSRQGSTRLGVKRRRPHDGNDQGEEGRDDPGDGKKIRKRSELELVKLASRQSRRGGGNGISSQTPSFLRPTKSSGARANSHARSGMAASGTSSSAGSNGGTGTAKKDVGQSQREKS